MASDKQVQAIVCRCSVVIDAYPVPYCYDDFAWQKKIAEFSDMGCKIELIPMEDYRKGRCACVNVPPVKKNIAEIRLPKQKTTPEKTEPENPTQQLLLL